MSNLFLKQTPNNPSHGSKRSKRRTVNALCEDAVGTEAVARKSLQVHAKHFAYPPAGFQCCIEHSLLFTFIRESTIFPQDVVLQGIQDESNVNGDGGGFEKYFYVRPSKHMCTKTLDVSFAQLTALLALAAEEWPHDSQVPPTLCKAIVAAVLAHADKENLDRQEQVDLLLQPLYKYATTREARHFSAKMLPWLVPALTVSVITINPLPFYGTLLATNLVEAKNLEKRTTSKHNTQRMLECGGGGKNSRNNSNNKERVSLLGEVDYEQEQDGGIQRLQQEQKDAGGRRDDRFTVVDDDDDDESIAVESLSEDDEELLS